MTSVQGLIDIRNQLDRHAAPELVEWHFASVNSRWTKRALAAAGFGYPSSKTPESLGHWKPIFSVAALSGADDEPATHKGKDSSSEHDDEIGPFREELDSAGMKSLQFPSRAANVHGINRPFFHLDVQAAVESAIMNAENKKAISPSITTVEVPVKPKE